MPKLNSQKYYSAWALSAIGYIILAYFTTRENTSLLLSTYVILFAIYLYLIYRFNNDRLNEYIRFSIVLKLVLLFSLPQLSDDFYRFIWDGHLVYNGVNPFSTLPSSIDISDDNFLKSLYPQLNSQNYHSVYPPVSQWIFTFSVIFPGQSLLGSVILIRLMILAIEIGSLFLLLHITQKFRIPQKNVFIYALNPLVILELTGNLHFEAFMIFFMLLTMALLLHKRFYHAGAAMGLAVGVKLLPVIFLPLFLKRLKWLELFKFSAVIGTVVILIFIPFLDQSHFSGFFESLNLYFQRFEFNASLYYLMREWGYHDKGFNIIASAGPFMAKIGMVLIGLLVVWDYWKSKAFAEMVIWLGLIYFLTATTVHPWYITTLIAFSVLSKFKWPILWSFLVFFTYSGYSLKGYEENVLILWIEYLFLIGFIVYELRTKMKKTSLVTYEI